MWANLTLFQRAEATEKNIEKDKYRQKLLISLNEKSSLKIILMEVQILNHKDIFKEATLKVTYFFFKKHYSKREMKVKSRKK